jgi:hypothetical protein
LTKPADTKVDKPKVDTSHRTATSKQTVDKKTEVNKPAQNQSNPQTAGSHERDRNQDRPNPNPNVSPPQIPALDPARNPPGSGHQPRTNQTPGVRTFPNGVRIVTQPDGTRIMIMPNGTTRVIPPGERPNRRRRP